MLIGLLIGGSAAVAVLAGLVFSMKRFSVPSPAFKTAMDPSDLPPAQGNLPIWMKLRAALAEAEREARLCAEEIGVLCGYQMQLLHGVGKPSHIEVADKPLFFKFVNPVLGESRYYYERDLWEDAEPAVLSQTKQVLENYAVHIALYESKWRFFQRLAASHQENIDRIDGIQRQKNQLDQLREHQARLEQLESEKQPNLEAKIIQSAELMKDIETELSHQELCFREYAKLTEKYNNAAELGAFREYKQEVDRIIARLEP